MQPITYDILAYLSENPDAQDSKEGIAEWWLSEQTVKPNMAVVAEALTELVDRGLILARNGKDARTFYKVNRRRMKEISMLLTQFKNSDATND
ncbi:MAG: MarR family transcriptional regulator [Acidobacteria bacterium]|nr:MarR family transcriptional regulator [Acidobacteriota bacterium]